jgi:hypothetical protein
VSYNFAADIIFYLIVCFAVLFLVKEQSEIRERLTKIEILIEAKGE